MSKDNNFKIGDIVLFSWKPNYAKWRKGKVVANNFAMCNLPDFFGTPEYFISELDENDNIINSKKSVAIAKDSDYIVLFEKGMEWCIGKSSSIQPKVINDFIEYTDEYAEEIAEADYHRWKNQFKKVSLNDYISIPGFKEVYDNEQKWRNEIEKKLDDIIEKLNMLLITRLEQYTYPEYPPKIWYSKPYKYNPDDFKVWCNKEQKVGTETWTLDTSVLNSTIKPGDPDYIMRCNPANTTITFDYKKYNDMCTCTDANFKPDFCNNGPTESTMFGNEVIDEIK